MTSVVVIGAGAVGCNAALFLDKLGFDVSLLESSEDILSGSPQVTFINHGDGFEYYKRHHQRTGEYCIEGSFVKALVYPMSALSTEACDADNPIRFFVSKGSIRDRRISKEGFERNARHMMTHYGHKYHLLRESCRLSDSEAEAMFVRTPREFMKPLRPEDFSDVQGVAAGFNGIGFGVNMPHYYALLKSALRTSRVDCRFSTIVTGITRTECGSYVVGALNHEFVADQILICTSHHIPEIAALVKNENHEGRILGSFFLNSMTFLRLPATSQGDRLHSARRINFTLMEKHGCMYACVVPPTSLRAGIAALYYPHPSGSQRFSHVCRPDTAVKPPKHWDHLVESGLPNDDYRVRRTFEQGCRLYPFLEGYAEISHTLCRTVFNASVRGSQNGLDRRVRELTSRSHQLTRDGKVSGWTAPKWTNAELSALMATDYVLEQSGLPGLEKDLANGFGPTRLDVAKITQRLNFRNIPMQLSDAKRYADQAHLPERIVRHELPQFRNA